MPVTAADVQRLILLEVGAGLDPVAVDQAAQNIGTVWAAYAAKAYWPGLQALYTKRRCIDILLGQTRRQISATVGPLTVPMQQVFDHLLAMRKEATADIVIMEKAARKGTYVDGDLTQTAPLMVPDLEQLAEVDYDRPDPNGPRYLGVR